MGNYNYLTGSTVAFSASVPTPISGSPITANSVAEGFRTLADRTAFLSSSLLNTAQMVTRSFSACSALGSNMEHDLSGNPPQVSRLSRTVGGTKTLSYFYLNPILPHSASLYQYQLYMGDGILTSSIQRVSHAFASNGSTYNVPDLGISFTGSWATTVSQRLFTSSIGQNVVVDKRLFDYYLVVEGQATGGPSYIDGGFLIFTVTGSSKVSM